jgi:hypothetical protein
MKKLTMIIEVSMLLICLEFNVQSFIVEANFEPTPPQINVNSPTNNGRYYTSLLTLNVEIISFFDDTDTSRKAEYTLDGCPYTPLQLDTHMEGGNTGSYPHSVASASVQFPMLSDGKHILIVTAEYTVGPHITRDMKIINFYIQTTDIPSPTPSPTQTPNITSTPSVTTAPTSNQNPASNILINPITLASIAIGIVILAMASTSLVYFNRKRNKIANMKRRDSF